jgi:chromosomal replication initiator protein
MSGRISVDRIKAAVAAEFRIPICEMTSDRRALGVARPRQVAMALTCQLTPCSFPTIGRVFGNRDHTTVLYARRRVDQLRSADGEFDRRVRRLERQLATPMPFRDPVQLAFLDGPLFDCPTTRGGTA